MKKMLSIDMRALKRGQKNNDLSNQKGLKTKKYEVKENKSSDYITKYYKQPLTV